ncbi:MAG TPA: phosphodiester glycosidase family protein [Longimicrobium sp.]|nr:phosphodiester glycosidase family protein [Longimicrobium sp.]
MRRAAISRLAAAAAVAVLAPACARGQRGGDTGIAYQEMRAGGRVYQVVRVDLRQANVRLYWKDEGGRPFGSLTALDRWLAARGERLLAATNAGIFYRTREPAGLHVERGAPPLRPLNPLATPPPGEAAGNFFSQPNGVFYVSRSGVARIVPTARAAPFVRTMAEATQSGPLLLHDGTPHLLIGRTDVARNAVAVCSPTNVALVLSPQASIRELALFIRDRLHCRDALYLDGTISGLRVPGARVNRDGQYDYVGIIGVTARPRP